MHAGIANYRFLLKSAAGENVPGIPGACATCNFTYLVRGPCKESTICTRSPFSGHPFHVITLFRMLMGNYSWVFIFLSTLGIFTSYSLCWNVKINWIISWQLSVHAVQGNLVSCNQLFSDIIMGSGDQKDLVCSSGGICLNLMDNLQTFRWVKWKGLNTLFPQCVGLIPLIFIDTYLFMPVWYFILYNSFTHNKPW